MLLTVIRIHCQCEGLGRKSSHGHPMSQSYFFSAKPDGRTTCRNPVRCPAASARRPRFGEGRLEDLSRNACTLYRIIGMNTEEEQRRVPRRDCSY